jgi:septal ring factor EnvC (AmiA/AmiB activator)
MYWPAINSIVILCFAIVIILAFSQIIRRLADKQADIDVLKKQLDEQNDKITIYENITNRQQQQITDINKNLTACLAPLEQLEARIEEVASTTQLLQSNIDSESSEHKLYGRAKKMIEMGADIDELVVECEIPRAEAELLISIYKK